MLRKKDDGCDEMKSEVQIKLLAEWEGLSGSEVRRRILHDLDKPQRPAAMLWQSIDEGTSGLGGM